MRSVIYFLVITACFAGVLVSAAHAETKTAEPPAINCVIDSTNGRVQSQCINGTTVVSDGVSTVTCGKDNTGELRCVKTILGR